MNSRTPGRAELSQTAGNRTGTYKFIPYLLERDTVSFFCDSEEQLEILNFLPHIQDLGLTACRSKKPGSPKRCLPVPEHKACQSARALVTGPSAATHWKQKI